MKQKNLGWISALALLSAIVTAAFGYRSTFGEPDMGSMVMGIVYGAVAGDPQAGNIQYGMPFSFGYYQLLYALLPPEGLRDAGQVTRAINYTGLAFSLLFAAGLGLMLSKMLQRGAALFVTAAFLFSPMVLPFLASGHPFSGACAMFFLATWLALQSQDATGVAQRALYLVATTIALTASMTLRGDIALALPFIPALYWAVRARPLAHCWRELALLALAIGAAFGAFLLLQAPYVRTSGGAGGSLMGFINKFVAIDRMGRGMVVFVMVLGLGTIAALTVGGWKRLRRNAPALPRLMLLALAVLFLPSLLFWLANPQPARHFLFPVLSLFILAGMLWGERLVNLGRAAGWALLLVLANQLLAEATRPVIVSKYQWAYDSGGIRRATQQVPIGLFPLDQQANRATQSAFHDEARRIAADSPQRLVFFGDTREYVVAELLSADPTLRFEAVKVGTFDTWLLSNGTRRLYIADKRFQWPQDPLVLLLAQPELASYPIYVQPGTMSRHDRTPLPAARAYRPAAEVSATDARATTDSRSGAAASGVATSPAP